MVRLVSGGVAEFDAFAYQDRHPSTIQFISDQLHNVTDAVTDAGRKFFEGAKHIYESALSSNALRKARALKQSVTSIFQRPDIHTLWDLAEVQQASLPMQRFIMANEGVRKTWREQRIDGYSDTYVDMHPGTIGEGHYDWRLLHNGIVREVPAEKEGEEAGFVVSWFFEDLAEGDRELDVFEQATGIDAGILAYGYVEIGENDPTSPLDAMM